MAFDPDAYLASKEPSSKGGFDPDAYLKTPAPSKTADTGITMGDVGEAARGAAVGVGKGLWESGKEAAKTTVSALPTRLPGTFMGAVEKGAEFGRQLPELTRAIPKLWERRGEISEEAKKAYKQASIYDKFEKPFEIGTQLLVAALGPSAVAKIAPRTGKLIEVLNTQFGGDASKLAQALKTAGNVTTKERAVAADKLAAEAKKAADAATRTAGEAERVAAKQTRKAAGEYRGAPGVRTVEEAGAFRPVPETTQGIGERLKGYADKAFDTLFNARKTKGDKNAASAFQKASELEATGQRVVPSEALKELDQAISETSIPSDRQQLLKLRDALEGKKLDETSGEVIGAPLNFKQIEYFRRFMKDRASGLPAEGFDAINQQLAGRVANKIESAMSDFMKGTGKEGSNLFSKFLDDWRKDSEQLIVFRSRIGKALVGEEAKAMGYAQTPAANIPGRVFANKDSFNALVDALGGNRQLAEAEARKYFASEMERLAGNPDKIRQFIASNRAMLSETKSKDMAEQLLARTTTKVGRGEAATARAAAEKELAKGKATSAEAAEKQKKSYELLNTEINRAKTADEIVAAHSEMVKKLFKDGIINQSQMDQMLARGESALKAANTKSAAKKAAMDIAKLVGLPVAGYVGYQKLFGGRDAAD